MREDAMPVYERDQSRDRASRANMGKFYDTNAPGIRINNKMSRLYSLHIHLLLCQRMTPLQHYPNNCLDATYSTVCQIALNMPDKPVKCLGSLYHCDAPVLLWDGGEREPDQAHVLSVSRHNYLTSTIPQPFVSTDPQ